MNASISVFGETRPPFFANRFLRLLIKTAAAQELGTDCLALLCVIVMTEDARRYRGPVTFWNNQLLPLVGFSKWERLDKARRTSIDAGWLVYEPGGRHKSGRYRVTIPTELQDVEDAAVDEGQYPSTGYLAGDQESLGLLQADSDKEGEADIKRESTRISTGGTSIPIPEPSPVPNPTKDAADASGGLTRPGKRSSRNQAPVPIPDALDTKEVLKALDEFKEHRRQIRKKLTPLAEQKLLAEWSEKGAARFVAAVNHSIANGWHGLFEPNNGSRSQDPKQSELMGSLNRFVEAGDDA